MKQKHGLHKKISSIFDGVPIPQRDTNKSAPGQDTQSQTPAAPADPPVHKQNPAVAPPSSPILKPNSEQQKQPYSPTPKPTAPQQQTQAPQKPQQPAQSKPLPQPLKPAASKPAAPKPKSKPVLKTKFKSSKRSGIDKVKAFFSSMNEDTEQAKQKKMAVVVGMLFPIFIAVLFFTLRQPKDTKANQTDQTDGTASVIKKTELTWAAPELLPENLRDPMRFGTVTTDNNSNNNTSFDQLPVKGIVFSETRPTAIIGNSILAEGESIRGITVVKINKDSVEFEKDGKKWIQQVQK